MSYLGGIDMPKAPETKRVEAHIPPEWIEQFEALAKEKDWSSKKLAENIIIEHLKSLKKKKK
jgi:hypothetical protein